MSIFKKENGALVEYTNPLPADYVAPIEDGATSAHDYAVGAFALVKGVLRKITTAVTSGTAITNANSEITTVAEQLEEINTDLSAVTLFEGSLSLNDSTEIPEPITNFKRIAMKIAINGSGSGDGYASSEYFNPSVGESMNCGVTFWFGNPTQGYCNMAQLKFTDATHVTYSWATTYTYANYPSIIGVYGYKY